MRWKIYTGGVIIDLRFVEIKGGAYETLDVYFCFGLAKKVLSKHHKHLETIVQ